MICKHFGVCGGCKFQDINYSEQLLLKEQQVKDLIYKHSFDAPLKPINHFNQWFYRNKMEFTFSQDENGEIVCGMHSVANKRQVFNLKECKIFSKDIGLILDAIRDFASENEYTSYDKFKHRGFLRHIIIRETKFSDQMMIGLVTSNENVLRDEAFVDMLKDLSLSKEIKSVSHITNDSLGDAVTFEKTKLLYGEPFIVECLEKFEFKIYIDSFFQTNPVGVVELYKKIREYASVSKNNKVLDLYCGAGTIALFLAENSEFVWGVEMQDSAINNATNNAKENKIKNVSFICEDVRKFLIKGNLIDKIELVMINPPRSGLSKKIKKRILELNAPHIFYSSCNPKTLFVDLEDFSNKYKIEFIEPFDFFPHTPHLEVFVALKRL